MSERDSIDDIWVSDCLDRRIDAESIQVFLDKKFEDNRLKNGFVLAVNGRWGCGKTYMLSSWFQQAKIQNRCTVFFDAWKNDFSNEPLLSFIAEVDSALQTYINALDIEEEGKRDLGKKLKGILKPLAKVVGAVLIKHAVGMSVEALTAIIRGEDFDVKDAIKKHGEVAVQDTGQKLEKLLEESLRDHEIKKTSIHQFRQELEHFVVALKELSKTEKPLIIFIDELDRCRPTYAIELLEAIKHLFGVPGVCFVIGTNVDQLSHSIKAIYGESFDGIAYLRRFFDIQYSIDAPSIDKFAMLLMSGINLPELAKLKICCKPFRVKDRFPEINALNIVAFIFSEFSRVFGLSLRDMSQVSLVLDAAIQRILNKKYKKASLNQSFLHPTLLIFFAVIYQKYPKTFIAIKEFRKFVDLDPSVDLSKYESELKLGHSSLGLTVTVNDIHFSDQDWDYANLDLFAEVQLYFDVLNNESESYRGSEEHASALSFYNRELDFKDKSKFFDVYIDLIEKSASFGI